MNKHAVILAGGKGTRLRPYTYVLPKPLMPIGEQPILETIIRQLSRHGFTNITLAVNHQADLIQSYFNDGAKWGVSIEYSLEHQPLGTMGPLKLVRQIPDHFLVMNGDVLTDLNFGKFYDRHISSQELFTIASAERKQTNDYGVLLTENDRLTGFEEKPISTFQVSMGVYMLSRAVVDFIPTDAPYGFDQLMVDLLNNGKKVSVHQHAGYWLAIGRPDDYEQAIKEFESMQHILDGD